MKISAACVSTKCAQFFSTYYHPANASLALAGDINPDQALELARAYFGDVPAGPAVAPVALEDSPLVGETRLLIADRVELPRLYIAWLTTAMFTDGRR